MLSVTGMISVSGRQEIRINEFGKGAFINFMAVSQDPAGEQKMHYYPAAVWVPKDEIEKWQGLIKTGAVFLMTHAHWSALYMEETSKFPQMQLKIHRNNLHVMQTPYWAATKAPKEK